MEKCVIVSLGILLPFFLSGRPYYKCDQCACFISFDDNAQESVDGNTSSKRKRAITCSDCGQAGHTKRSKKCPGAQQTNN